MTRADHIATVKNLWGTGRIEEAFAALDALAADLEQAEREQYRGFWKQRALQRESELRATEARVEQLEADIRKHTDAISGEDGGLEEHGPCLVCDLLWPASNSGGEK